MQIQLSEEIVKQVSIKRFATGMAATTSERVAKAAALALALLTSGVYPQQEPQQNSQSKVPADLNYDVWMNDKALGTHTYRFALDGLTKQLRVDSKARFNVKVLFVNVFSYDHSASEFWSGHCLSSLSSRTSTNGKPQELQLRFDDKSCAGTYSYWDRARLQRSTLVNAQTGEQHDASWTQLGTHELPKPGKKTKFLNPPDDIAHYRLDTSEASFLLWYDSQGRNLAMQTTNDGRTITYINRELF